jgi:hypothetical protein
MASYFNDIKKELDELKLLENKTPSPVILTTKNFPPAFDKNLGYNTQMVAALYYFKQGELQMLFDTVKSNILNTLQLDADTTVLSWPLDYKDDAVNDLKSLSAYLKVEMDLEKMLDTSKINPNENGYLYLFLVVVQQGYYK